MFVDNLLKRSIISYLYDATNDDDNKSSMMFSFVINKRKINSTTKCDKLLLTRYTLIYIH